VVKQRRKKGASELHSKEAPETKKNKKNNYNLIAFFFSYDGPQNIKYFS
jgi:hypothetical protein